MEQTTDRRIIYFPSFEEIRRMISDTFNDFLQALSLPKIEITIMASLGLELEYFPTIKLEDNVFVQQAFQTIMDIIGTCFILFFPLYLIISAFHLFNSYPYPHSYPASIPFFCSCIYILYSNPLRSKYGFGFYICETLSTVCGRITWSKRFFQFHLQSNSKTSYHCTGRHGKASNRSYLVNSYPS